MPSYRDSQFISSQRKVTDKQNAPYIYPRRRVRYVDEVQVREGGNFSETVFGRVSKELDRGFIRNLITTTNRGEEIRRRFNFQFNPSDIVQAVQMRNDIYLGVLQDPAQYAQPLSAVASFGFDILLDRTMEVGTDRNSGASVNVLGVTNPDEDVYQIGVLSDLQVLYSIIGQGFSNELIAENLEVLKNIAKKSAGATITDDAERNSVISAIDSKMNLSFESDANVGNNAFLIPMPVRIVFSELFMVDGFITSTQVRFTKFNTHMVPIQASIALTMNALYIGFTKEKTFLTENIQANLEEIEREKREEVITNSEILAAARQSANQFVFCTDHSDSWLKELGVIERDDQWWPIGRYAVSNDAETKEFKLGFKDGEEQGDKDKIYKLYTDGLSFTVAYNWTLRIYGTYVTSRSALQAMTDAKKGGGDPTSDVIGSIPRLVGEYTYYDSANDAGAWEGYTVQEGDAKLQFSGIRANSIKERHPAAKNLASGPLPPDEGNYDDRYFIVHLKVAVEVAGTFKYIDHWQVLKGDKPFLFEQTLGWPDNRGYSYSGFGV